MERITPHLWFDKEAVEAAEFYSDAFPGAKVINVSTIKDTPSGDCDIVSFELLGQPFMAISAGPLFRFTPAISFLVRCATPDQVDALWSKLSEGGNALMPLASTRRWSTPRRQSGAGLALSSRLLVALRADAIGSSA